MEELYKNIKNVCMGKLRFLCLPVISLDVCNPSYSSRMQIRSIVYLVSYRLVISFERKRNN